MTLPASTFVSVVPSVLAAGAPPLSMSGLLVTQDQSIPIGTVKSFPNAAAVSSWFGPGSNQAAFANVYFGGYTGCTQLPGSLLMAQFNAAAISGYNRGGSVAALTLAQIQALNGTITILIDGVSHVSSAINLSSASSFTTAASLIQTGLQSGTPTTTATVTYDALRTAFVITSSTTGGSSSVGYGTDVSLSPSLYFTAAAGATLAAGSAINTPASAMALAVAATTNWAAFTTDFMPTLLQMEGFASWVTTQNQAYLYVPYDNTAAVLTGPDAASLGVITAAYNGVACIYNPSGLIAAFVLGAIASINFQAVGGRITLAYKGQAGLVPDITSLTAYQNAIANHYSAYVSVASATEQFQFFQNGQVSGNWLWIDSYINQIYFSGAFQGALLTLLASVNSIPYTTQGFANIAAALQPVINQMLSFGAAVAGGTLSGSQSAEVNAATGLNATQAIQNNGYFLSITAPSAGVQSARGTPVIVYYYFDGESVQTISMGTIDVE
jgi:hypothetical protein